MRLKIDMVCRNRLHLGHLKVPGPFSHTGLNRLGSRGGFGECTSAVRVGTNGKAAR